MNIVRNSEAWICGAFGVLVLAACLDGKPERAQPPSALNAVPEVELVQPEAAANQPMVVVYVVGKRPSTAEKRAMRAGKG